MIKQLQRRFIRIAVVALTVAMVLVVGIVNVANWISVRGELFSTLSLIVPAETTDEIPAVPVILPSEPAETAPPARREESGATQEAGQANDPFPPRNRHFRNMVAESKWFTGILSEEGEVKFYRLEQMENLEEETARELVFQAAGGNRTEGILQDYLFRVQTLRSGKKRVVLLNCETRLTAVRNLILISVIACAGGILLAWLLVTLASRKAVEPTIRNMEQQKQFITNASHELKTPLTVISTNMELMEMEDANNPWIKSTQKQTATLRRLVDELVYLSRMEEENSRLTVEQIGRAHV